MLVLIVGIGDADAGLTNQASIDNNNTIIKLSITSIM